MNLSTSTQTASSILSLAVGGTATQSPKTGAAKGSDGFGDLLTQLSSILPGAGDTQPAPVTVASDRQTGELPTGKNLPVAAKTTVAGGEDEGSEAGETAMVAPCEPQRPGAPAIAAPSLAVMPVLDPQFTLAASRPDDSELPSQFISSRPANGPVLPAVSQTLTADFAPKTAGAVVAPAHGREQAAKLDASVAQTAPKSPAAPAAAIQNPAALPAQPVAGQSPLTPPPAIAPATMAAQQTQSVAAPIQSDVPKGIAVRIAAADAPVSVQSGAAPTIHQPGTATAVTTPTGAQPATAPVIAAQAAAALGTVNSDRASVNTREGSAPATAPITQPIAAAQANRNDGASAQSSERRGNEQAFDAAPTPKTVQSNVDTPRPITAAIQNAAEAIDTSVRAAVGTPRIAAGDALGNIERIVDQLSAARQFDLSKPAALAVMHREFGALTVTFDQSADSLMNVRVAAEDGEAQKALAAAIAADRGGQRPQENQMTSAQANASLQTAGGERGAGNGAGAGQAQAGFDQNGNAERRSGQSDTRDRRDQHGARSDGQPPQSSSDEALYA